MTSAQPANRSLSNLQLRVISAVVLAAVVLTITWIGGMSFRVLAALIAMAIVYEWCTIARGGKPALKLGAGVLLGIAMLALAAGLPATTVIALVAAAAAVVLVAGILMGEGAETAISVAYAGAAAISLAFLRDGDTSGLLAILYLFAVVWATDILAYFVGRAIGGPKLAPSISPGKTWSGAVGGAVGGVLAGVLFSLAEDAGNVAVLAFVALLLSVVSQIGDLFESAVKRRHGAKDSGSLIPGHGGVMDRVDGLVAAAFALYLIGAAAGGLDNPARSLFP